MVFTAPGGIGLLLEQNQGQLCNPLIFKLNNIIIIIALEYMSLFKDAFVDNLRVCRFNAKYVQ
jgi:hypothetical protein